MLVLTIKSYQEIEDQRNKVTQNLAALEHCLIESYSENPGLITKHMLNEALSSVGTYSRLNAYLVSHYILGSAEEVPLKQIFWKEG